MNKKWDKFYKENGRFYLLPHPEIENLIKIFRTFQVFNVIDIGCGSGSNILKLAQDGFDVTGLDYSVVAAHLAEEHLRKNNLKGKVYTGNYQKDLSHFEEDIFDAAISINSLQYVTESEDFSKTLFEIQRVVKPEGIFFLVVPSEKTIIIEPNIPQKYWAEDELIANISLYFDVKKSFYDDHNALCVISTAKK